MTKKTVTKKTPKKNLVNTFRISLVEDRYNEVKEFDIIMNFISSKAGLQGKGVLQSIILDTYNKFLNSIKETETKIESHFDLPESYKGPLRDCFKMALRNVDVDEAENAYNLIYSLVGRLK